MQHGARLLAQKCSASFLAAAGVLELRGTLSSSFALGFRARRWQTLCRKSSVCAGAVVANLQREQCCIDTHCAQRGGAPVPGAGGVCDASQTRNRSFAQRHRDQVQAHGYSQRDAVATALVTACAMCCIGARCTQKWRCTCSWGQLGRLNHMGHKAVALRCSIVLGCWQTPSLRQLRCAVAAGSDLLTSAA